MGRRILSAVLACGLGGLFGLGVLEIGLRVYNPVPLPIRGKQISLPVRKHVVYHNPVQSEKVDPVIEVTRNGLGFRGPDPPADFDAHLTFVAVGGSTTECRFLSDGKTWPDRVAARLSESFESTWVNNAGLDGHSTFGHRVLLDQVLLELEPDYLLFLVGVNDVGRDDVNEYDATLDPELASLRDRVIRASELLSTVQVLVRSLRATELGLEHLWELDLTEEPAAPVVEEEIVAAVARHERDLVPGYGRRLADLVRTAREAGIEPILITQPVLWSEGPDAATGVPIGPLVYGDQTAAMRSRVLDAYNREARRVGAAHGVLVIDAGRGMPKDSRLYYDWMHYSNAGAERMAEIVSDTLIPWLRSREEPARLARRAAPPARPTTRPRPPESPNRAYRPRTH